MFWVCGGLSHIDMMGEEEFVLDVWCKPHTFRGSWTSNNQLYDTGYIILDHQ